MNHKNEKKAKNLPHQQHILQNVQKQLMKSSEIGEQTLYHMSNIFNASYSTLHDLRTLKGVPMKCHPLSTSPSLMNIELSNFNACYNGEVTK